METNEAESWNGNRKRKAGTQNWSGKLERAADVWKWSPKTNARVCDNFSKLVLTGGKMEVRGSESVLILEPVLFVVAFSPIKLMMICFIVNLDADRNYIFRLRR